MANVAEDLIAFLLADGTVSASTTNIHYNSVKGHRSDPFIFIQRTDRLTTRCLDGALGPEEYIYVLECVGTNLNTTQDLMDDCLTALDGYQGSFGGRTVAFCHAEALDSDYESRNTYGTDKDYNIAAMLLSVGVDGR